MIVIAGVHGIYHLEHFQVAFSITWRRYRHDEWICRFQSAVYIVNRIIQRSDHSNCNFEPFPN